MRRVIRAAGRAVRSIGRVFRGGGGMNDRIGRDPNATNNRSGYGY